MALQLGGLFLRRQVAQIHEGQLWIAGCGNKLDGAVFADREGGAEHLVAADDFGQARGQRGHVQRASQRERAGHVECGTGTVVLVEKPQPLLGKRQRPHLGLARVYDRRDRGRSAVRLAESFNVLAEQSDRGQVEYPAGFEFHVERVADARTDLGCQERVTAELEEPVVNADALQLQDFAVDFRDLVFGGRARGHVGAVAYLCRLGRRRQRCAVDLAVGRHGQRVQHDKRFRNHVCGQCIGEKAAQRGDARRRGDGHDVTDQAKLARAALLRRDYALLHLRMAGEHGLDFADLDACPRTLTWKSRRPRKSMTPSGRKLVRSPEL